MTHTKPGVGIGERFVPFADLMANAARAAMGFHSLGVTAGDVVAILMRNDIPIFEAIRGAGLLGAYAVPINWHAPSAEVDAVLRDSAARVLVAHSDLLAQRASLPAGATVLAVPTPQEILSPPPADSPLPQAVVEWASWRDSHDELPADRAATAAGSMFYTSGTTGLPKTIRRLPRTPDQAAAYAALTREVYGIDPPVSTVVTGPMYHSAPLYHAMQAFQSEGHVVLQPRFAPLEMLRLIEQHAVTNLLMVPTMFIRLLQLPEAERSRYDVSSLRHVVHGAAPCPIEVKRRMIEWFGPIILEYYGCTESGIVTSCTSREWLDHPGTVGRAVRGAVVKVMDETGVDAAPGQWGEVLVRNPGAGDFDYPGHPEERRAAERYGLTSCGDIGHLDEQAYLYLDDRQRDMVISGGVNLFPAEIELALMGLPGVADAAVFGIPDPEYGERLAALIQPESGVALDPDSIKRQVAERVGGGLKVPKVVEIRDALPRDDAGKLLKRLLREPYWQGHERRI